ncbi:uncharacterized protein F5891DRAFT_1192325 [Suillus fuscotomentosus]|uniref:Uncharacterized protein n=1 Tax=Suillus fuscotomentosus TaxID=1912939 RepID=A0AAD4HI86_9AGAM|nr:uncharacterized protein F5891DRAFT_1192325 [Suillus fuscotomentosus]KAG1897146.1 hypothetical protein F5891DRAFT_1192325 [Suillus fuscotomentosus]
MDSLQNLLALVHVDFPWFSDLDSIWHNNPSMVAKTYLSQPGLAGAGPSIPAAQSSHAYMPPNLPPSAYPPLTSFVNEQSNVNISLTSSINEQSNANVPLTSSVNMQLNVNILLTSHQRAVECEHFSEASQNA